MERLGFCAREIAVWKNDRDDYFTSVPALQLVDYVCTLVFMNFCAGGAGANCVYVLRTEPGSLKAPIQKGSRTRPVGHAAAQRRWRTLDVGPTSIPNCLL